MESDAIGDDSSRVCLHVAAMLALTSLAQISYTLATSPSSSFTSVIEFRTECSNALERTIKLFEELEPEGRLSLDGAIGVRKVAVLPTFHLTIFSSTSGHV